MFALALGAVGPFVPPDALVASLVPPALHTSTLIFSIALTVLGAITFSHIASARCALGPRRGPVFGCVLGLTTGVLFFAAVRWEERARAYTQAREIVATLQVATPVAVAGR